MLGISKKQEKCKSVLKKTLDKTSYLVHNVCMQSNLGSQNIIYTIQEIKDMLAPVFSNAPVQKAILFGSYANGSATANSDIDIVIDSQNTLTGFKFFNVMGRAEEQVGKPVDMFDLSEIEKTSPMFSAIQNEGVVLYER